LREVYGYDHPPRAARVVREAGIPLESIWTTSSHTGRRIGAYRFGDANEIRRGRIAGRRAFAKAFKDELVSYYDSRDAIADLHATL